MDAIDEKSLNNLSIELEAIDKELMSQLERLANDIPEIYAGYAKLVTEVTCAVMKTLKPSNATAAGIAAAAQVITRGLNAYGAYKAAKEHNRLLFRTLQAKQAIASANHSKIRYLIPKINNNHQSCSILLSKILSSTYELDNVPAENIRRMSSIVLRVVNMYRTLCYFKDLAHYLDRVYSSWLSGSHTSGLDLPDMYNANARLMNRISSHPWPDAISDALMRNGTLKGDEFILIADAQLSMMALKESWVTVNTRNAHPGIREIMNNNPTFKRYEKLSKPVRKHIEFSPALFVSALSILPILATLYICYTYQSSETWETIALGALGIAAILRIAIRGKRSLQIAHVQQGEALFASTTQAMNLYCGKIETKDFDYSIKDEKKEMWLAFKS